MTHSPIHKQSKALAYGLAAILLWSTVATAFKLGLRYLAIEQLLFLGIFTSWLFFLSVLLLKRSFRLLPEDRIVAPLMGLLNPFAYYLILFTAYERLPAHIAQPLNYTWAIALAILSIPILKEPLTKNTTFGIALSFLGVFVLVYFSNPQTEQSIDTIGVCLALLSTVFWALYWIAGKRSQSDPISFTFVAFSTALPLSLYVCLDGPGMPEIDQNTLTFGLWVGLIEMGVTYILWQRALERTNNTGRMAQLIFLSPFISLVFIATFLGENITPATIIALLIIVIGTWVTQRKQLP